MMTIGLFNKLTGQQTLHPLAGLADLSGDRLSEDLRMPCDFYALLCRPDEKGARNSLQLIIPGEMFEIPSTRHKNAKGYTGVLFHPDLLCDTPLERHIGKYSCRCNCQGALTQCERRILVDCLREIDQELHHAIDRYTSAIIVSHIALLLNYCTRFCDQKCIELP